MKIVVYQLSYTSLTSSLPKTEGETLDKLDPQETSKFQK